MRRLAGGPGPDEEGPGPLARERLPVQSRLVPAERQHGGHGEAKFSYLHSVDSARVHDGLRRAERAIDSLLNLIGGRLGHDRVLFGRYAMPVLVHYLDRHRVEASADAPPGEVIYFPEIERKHPGGLASQWIPEDPELWRIENYLDFLQARQRLLARAANLFLAELAHEAPPAEEEMMQAEELAAAVAPPPVSAIPGGVESEEEEELLLATNQWVVEQGLPEGVFCFELADPESGEPVAMFDLAWENGLQVGYSQPVTLLLNEGPSTLSVANAHGFRYFTDVESFRRNVEDEILALDTAAEGTAAA